MLLDRDTRWRQGKREIKRRLRSLSQNEVNRGGIERVIRPVQARFGYRSLTVAGEGGEGGWDIRGAMSPGGPVAHADDTTGLHEGTDEDPIPLHWYKDPGNYPQSVRLRGDHGPLRVPMTAPTAIVVNGRTRVVGINSGNLVRTGHRLVRGTVYPRSGQPQRAFRNVLRRSEYNWTGKDADHVKDLGFGGTDSFGNLWPLNAGINRRGFIWYWTYRISYKKSPIKKSTVPLMFMRNKVFEVIGFRYPPPRPGGRSG